MVSMPLLDMRYMILYMLLIVNIVFCPHGPYGLFVFWNKPHYDWFTNPFQMYMTSSSTERLIPGTSVSEYETFLMNTAQVGTL